MLVYTFNIMAKIPPGPKLQTAYQREDNEVELLTNELVDDESKVANEEGKAISFIYDHYTILNIVRQEKSCIPRDRIRSANKNSQVPTHVRFFWINDALGRRNY